MRSLLTSQRYVLLLKKYIKLLGKGIGLRRSFLLFRDTVPVDIFCKCYRQLELLGGYPFELLTGKVKTIENKGLLLKTIIQRPHFRLKFCLGSIELNLNMYKHE